MHLGAASILRTAVGFHGLPAVVVIPALLRSRTMPPIVSPARSDATALRTHAASTSTSYVPSLEYPKARRLTCI